MKRIGAIIIMICLLAVPPVALGDTVTEDWLCLVGLWRYSGEAEVLGSGFRLNLDGSVFLCATDDHASFPPSRLIALNAACTWQMKDDTLILIFHDRQQAFDVKISADGKTIYLSQEEDSGQYERTYENVLVSLPPIPEDILAAASIYYDYRIEGYLEIPGTPDGDYAFLLIKSSDHRLMLCFRLDEFGWSQYFTADEAIPQAELHCSFIYEEKGLTYQRLWDDENKYEYTADGLGFGVYTDDGVIYMEGISFAWQDGGFHLTNYQDSPMRQMDYLDGQLIFYNIGDGFESAHPAAIETALEKVDFYALPRSPEEITAPKALTILPKSMDCILTGEKMAFTKGKRCPVYTGPRKRIWPGRGWQGGSQHQ